MLKLFEDFNKSIISKSFMKDGKIPRVDFYKFGKEYFMRLGFVSLNYSNLMRFYTYNYLLNYKGGDDYINMLVNRLKEKDKLYIEVINKIGMNNMVLNMINRKYSIGITHNKDTNIAHLDKLDEYSRQIFSEMNFRDFTSKIMEVTKRAKESEKATKAILSRIFTNSIIVDPTEEEDTFGGIDLWAVNKDTGDRDSIQVKVIKNPSNLTIEDNTYFIKNTTIDLKNYFKPVDKKLKYKYLVLVDANEDKLYQIKSNAIKSINKNLRSITIQLEDWIDKYPVVKKYNIPKKYAIS